MNRGRTLGIVGGGQLGRMLTLAAKPLGFDVIVLDPNPNSPAVQVGAHSIVADLYDPVGLKELAKRSDYLTVEIEHLDTQALEKLAANGHVIHPAPQTITLIQDKYLQKMRLQEEKIPVAPFMAVSDLTEANVAYKKFKGKLVIKTRHGAYDGRGNAVVKNKLQLKKALEHFKDQKLYAEKLIPFQKELAVIIARDQLGKVTLYPIVEMIHKRSICLEVSAPADISRRAANRARNIARKTARCLEGAGVFAIEMFLLADDTILVNEIAPRVHNSGHFTIEGCITSQFEQHVRAVTGLPLGSTRLVAPAATMINILGERDGEFELDDVTAALKVPYIHLHWYGKTPIKIDRKMGHITVTGDTIKQTSRRARQARRRIKV